MITYTCSTTKNDKGEFEEPEQATSHLLRGNFTFHAYSRSHDRKTMLAYTMWGFELRRGKNRQLYRLRMPYGNQGVYWSPDSSMVTMWAPPVGADGKQRPGLGLGLLKIREVDWSGPEYQAPPLHMIYVPPKGHLPFGVEWSPSGDAVYVIETMRENYQLSSRIVRVDLTTKFESQKGVTEIVRIGGAVDFFMPPVSRFEHGQGNSSAPYWIVFGHPKGLYLTDPKGKYVRRIARLPAVGLHNIEWHPTNKKGQFALYFRSSIRNADGEWFRGVHIVHLDRIGKKTGEGKPKPVVSVYPQTDVHTLWYSPKGKYLSWSSTKALYLCDPDKPKEITKITFKDEDGVPLEGKKDGIKGFTWHHDEKKIAIGVGPRVYIQELKWKKDKETKKDVLVEPTLIWKFNRATDFVAEPIWVGDSVFLSVFRDMSARFKKKEKTTFGVMTKEEREKLDREARKKKKKKDEN